MGMSAHTDLTDQARASGKSVEQEIESPTKGSVADTDSLVFICYRREDGQQHADWIDRALNGWEWKRPTGIRSRVRTYFDRTAPAVADWTKYHLPSLQTAKGLIVICTPGAAKDLSAPGKPDWLYREVRWWTANRTHPPIVIDVTADGAKWVPEPILQKWPNINRVPLRLTEAQSQTGIVDEQYLSRWRQQVERTLQESERATTFDVVRQLQVRLRNMTIALVAAAVLAVVSLGLAETASSMAKSTQALNRFLQGLFYTADPDRTLGSALTAGQLVDAGLVEATLSTTPSVKIEMLTAIGAAYTGLGEHEKANAALDDAARLAQQHRIGKRAQFNLAMAQGEALLYQDRFNEARAPLDRALVLSQAGADRSHALVALGDLDAWAPKGDRKLAQQRYSEAVAIDRDLNDPLNEARDRNRLGYLANKVGELTAAKDHFAAASSLVQGAHDVSTSLLVAKYELDHASALFAEGKLPEARSKFEISRKQLVAVYGEKSADVAIADNNLARIAIEQDNLAGLESLLTHAIEAVKSELGENYSDLAYLENNMGLVLRERGDRAGARRNFERAKEIAETNDDHGIAAQAIVHLAETYMSEGDLASAGSELAGVLKHFPNERAKQGWRYGLYEGAAAEFRIANCDKGGGEDLERSDTKLIKRWPWPNMFRRANERRHELLKTLQNNDTSRCRGASTHG